VRAAWPSNAASGPLGPVGFGLVQPQPQQHVALQSTYTYVDEADYGDVVSDDEEPLAQQLHPARPATALAALAPAVAPATDLHHSAWGASQSAEPAAPFSPASDEIAHASTSLPGPAAVGRADTAPAGTDTSAAGVDPAALREVLGDFAGQIKDVRLPPPMQPHACPRWPSSQCVAFKVTAELSELCARVSVCLVKLMSGLESRLGQFETRVDGSLSELHAKVTLMEGRLKFVERTHPASTTGADGAGVAAAAARATPTTLPASSAPASPIKEPADATCVHAAIHPRPATLQTCSDTAPGSGGRRSEATMWTTWRLASQCR